MPQLYDVFLNLVSSYKSIDIITLAIKNGNDPNQFINIATKITFSKEETVIAKPDITRYKNLLFIKKQMNSSHWWDIKEGLNKGKLTYILPNIEIDFLWNINIEDNPNGRFHAYIGDGYDWPRFECDINTDIMTQSNLRITNEIRHILSTLDINTSCKEAVLSFGYDSLHDLIQDKLKIGFQGSPCLIIVLPVYAKIGEVTIKQNKELAIPIIHHKEVVPLILLGWCARDNSSHRQDRFSENITEIETNDLILEKIITKPISLENKEEYYLYLDLKHGNLAESINKPQYSIRELILKNDIYPSPLYTALSLFIPNDKFVKIIDTPQTLELSNKKTPAEHVFEESICMLLSAGGMPTICLGKYEKLYSPNSNREIGSADLLSYDSKTGTLVVISCKTVIPSKSGTLDNIKNTAREIAKHINTKIYKVKAMLIINSEAKATKTEGEENGVIVFDKDGLTKLMDIVKLRQFNIQDFRPRKVKLEYIGDWS